MQGSRFNLGVNEKYPARRMNKIFSTKGKNDTIINLYKKITSITAAFNCIKWERYVFTYSIIGILHYKWNKQ